MIRCENVSKQYRLGAIGGTTLKEDLQRLSARLRKKEDPTSKIGQKSRPVSNEKFMALDGISFEVKKGEAVGIIGKNGAGKSTLLKLITRITGPSKGTISLNGRVASMLEVGTGFHPELTGRENIYMNGAILGMSKKEIDEKIEEIIDFSEVRQFIDTPVKRYSSGMYVKLAFSVAAHLDSEIVIMDEVLAVGDMAFQKKCLTKMRQTAKEDGRTVLYVSHNMNTIRQLCDRVIVLSKGRMIFDGDVDEGIAIYMGGEDGIIQRHNDFTKRGIDPWITGKIKMTALDVEAEENTIRFGSHFRFSLTYECSDYIENLAFRMTVLLRDRTPVATATTAEFEAHPNTVTVKNFDLDTSRIAPGPYIMQIVAFQPNGAGGQARHDFVPLAAAFNIYAKSEFYNFEWVRHAWGDQAMPQLTEWEPE